MLVWDLRSIDDDVQLTDTGRDTQARWEESVGPGNGPYFMDGAAVQDA